MGWERARLRPPWSTASFLSPSSKRSATSTPRSRTACQNSPRSCSPSGSAFRTPWPCSSPSTKRWCGATRAPTRRTSRPCSGWSAAGPMPTLCSPTRGGARPGAPCAGCSSRRGSRPGPGPGCGGTGAGGARAAAWLRSDVRHGNPVAERILGPTGMGTRRLFVLLPRSGKPVAVAHRIELQPLAAFPGEVRAYGSWRELHGELQALARGRTLAMEVSPQDAVPYLDRVPHGVVQLLEGFGARVVSSAPLVSRFAARWSAGEAEGHRRAAQALAEIAAEALAWAGRETARGAEVREVTLQQRVVEAIERAGLATDHPPIAAFGPNSAMPHYEPRAGADRRLEAGQVVLLDLWAGPTLGSVFADQTWMGFTGRAPDAEVRKVWQTVRGARDAAVALLRDRSQRPGKGEGGRVPTGAEVDDAARAVIRSAGYAEYFVHRTGHSIDRDLHGSGPHIDNFETADERPLVPGVGFSIEPGIYLPGRFGMRSEINVFMNETGPEVTPRGPQQELVLV